MIHWALFSTLATGVFYGAYLLVFRNDRQLQLRRWYLLAALAFSLAYPLVRLPQAVAAPTVVSTLPEVVVGGAQVQSVSAAPSMNLSWLPWALYIGGVAATLAMLAVQMLTAIRCLHRERVTLLDDSTAPFSFFGHITIGTRGMTDEELRMVLAHEEEHVRRRHTIDVVTMRLMCCVAWFNPFAWLMLRELCAVHEYQADAAVVLGNGKDYLSLLYRQAVGTGYGHITNKFNSINLKNRIVMMNRQKTRFGAWKLVAVLPVAALMLMFGCKPAAEKAAVAEPETTDEVFDEVEVSPEFAGGMEAMSQYLAENIQYPEQAKADGVEGRVMVGFVVEKDGSITDAEVLRGIGGGCDEEALRVVNAMPNWTPGKQNGEAVRTRFNLPVVFKLQ
jgi:TonB family protein